MAAGGRLRSLDGLRGLAALIVAAHHGLLTIPIFSDVYFGDSIDPIIAPLALSPLHALWAGREAVSVFFVLSGVVLTLPVMRSTRFSWLAYYPSRMLRLYLPVVAAVLFALALAILIPRVSAAGQSEWVQEHSESHTVGSVLRDMVLLGGTSNLDSPLWSLRWEVIFSLLLPLYVWVALRFRAQWFIVAPLLFGVCLVGGLTGSLALRVLPMFAFGCLIAAQMEGLQRLGARLDESRVRRWWAPVLAVVSVLALSSNGWLRALGFAPANHLENPITFIDPFIALGATVLVALAVSSSMFQRFLSMRVLAFLGAISFSFYLIHEPIIVSIAVLTSPDMVWLAPVAGIPLAIGLAWVFSRVIERPSHRAAKAVGSAVTTWQSRRRESADAV